MLLTSIRPLQIFSRPSSPRVSSCGSCPFRVLECLQRTGARAHDDLRVEAVLVHRPHRPDLKVAFRCAAAEDPGDRPLRGGFRDAIGAACFAAAEPGEPGKRKADARKTDEEASAGELLQLAIRRACVSHQTAHGNPPICRSPWMGVSTS